MEKTVFISLPVEDLQTLIIDCVNACLKNHQPNKTIIQNNTSDLLNIQEAADLLHLSVPTCYTKVSKRELPHTKKGGRLYFSRQELLGWLKQGRRKTNTELEQEANDYVALKK
jgi:excisionase family DNA binding protein